MGLIAPLLCLLCVDSVIKLVIQFLRENNLHHTLRTLHDETAVQNQTREYTNDHAIQSQMAYD